MPRLARLATLLLAIVLLPLAVRAEEKLRFNRDIRPILSGKCFQCHGPDDGTREAGLRLDVREGALEQLDSDARAIVPGKLDESELVRRITSTDEFERMPPDESNKHLTPAEIATLKRWIAEGAEYEGHWAFIAPRRPELPVVMQTWGTNPIDRFVLARLESQGLAPSKEADRRTLIRRVTFDLTGLPPTPEEVEAFVDDPEPNAYEKVVDRLLASLHYGEHMGRFWLDAARYGDTHGLHLDNYREMWPYRDWVVGAFNENMPYHRFATEQLAGDLLPNATLDQQVASGFNRCNVTTSEGGSIAEEVYVRNVTDRVDTFGTVFLGLTAGCAVCHDHKFDPVTQRDFYSLFAYFNNLDGNPLDGNQQDPPPVVRVPLPDHQRRLDEAATRLETVARAMQQREAEATTNFAEWLQVAEKDAEQSTDVTEGLLAHYPIEAGEGSLIVNAVDSEAPGTARDGVNRVKGRSDGWAIGFTAAGTVDLGDVGRFERTDRFSYGCWLETPGNVNGTPIARMDQANAFRGWDLYVTQKKVAMHLIHAWTGDAMKVTTRADVLKPDTWHHVFVTYDGSSRPGGVTIYVDGEPQPHETNTDTLKNSTITDVPARLGRRHADSHFTGGTIDDVRIYDRTLAADEVKRLAGRDEIAPILALDAKDRTPEQNEQLRRHFLEHVDEPYIALVEKKARIEAERTAIENSFATTLVFKERREPKQAFVLVRGNYDQHGDPVDRAVPGFLPPLPEGASNDRLGLARWLLRPDHPLFARVTVNRFWQHVFGTGLVKTSEDFGSQGEWPSHPELLDWLAVEFRESGWNVKRTLKLLVMSATYRQDSTVTPALLERDPANRLLARGPRYRLDAEQIRDQALAVSGLLVERVGGPSVKPPQPAGLWKAVGYSGSNTVNFKADTGDATYRRSVYTFWKRTAPPPQMRTLDAPSRESCQVRRERTNTPLQALMLMNEEQYVEACRHLAERTLREAKGPEAIATAMFTRVVARPPTEAERTELLAVHHDCLTEFETTPTLAAELAKTGNTPAAGGLPAEQVAAWTVVANTVLNLDEALNKN